MKLSELNGPEGDRLRDSLKRAEEERKERDRQINDPIMQRASDEIEKSPLQTPGFPLSAR